MALNTFLQINLPYGIEQNAAGEWFAFNREYHQLGTPVRDYSTQNMHDGYPAAKYKAVTEKRLLALAGGDVLRDTTGQITRVYLYTETNAPGRSDADMTAYLARLAKLAAFNVETPRRRKAL